MNQLAWFKDKKLIKVVTGIRRAGKSTLLQMFQDKLVASGVSKNRIISINLEDLSMGHLCDYKMLHDYVLEKLPHDQMAYVFIDEIQSCQYFQKAIDSLHLKKTSF